MLIGSKLVGWIGRKSNLAFLTASTRVQLTMGQEMSETVTTVNEVGQTVMKCLNRDPDWVAYHASELAEAAHAGPVNALGSRRGAEGVQVAAARPVREGVAGLRKVMADKELQDDAQRRAWLAATAARIAYQENDEDRGQKLQTQAFSISNNHSPPKVRPTYVRSRHRCSVRTAFGRVRSLLRADLNGWYREGFRMPARREQWTR
jgi:hypothetical protein